MPDRMHLFVRAGPISASIQVLPAFKCRTAHVLR
jgi:hypothetical protein